MNHKKFPLCPDRRECITYQQLCCTDRGKAAPINAKHPDQQLCCPDRGKAAPIKLMFSM